MQSRSFVALTVVCALITACGGGSDGGGGTPTAPTPQTQSRVIRLEANLDFGEMPVGASLERDLRIYNSGTASMTVTGMTGAAAGFSASWTNGTIAAGSSQLSVIRFSPTEERRYSGTLTVNADHTSGTNTIAISGTGARPPGPRTQFGSGQYIVGSDVAPGRYYNDPANGCYWERLSGLGGTLGEVLANEFIGFDAGQWIVDIVSSDRAFKTDAECGTWFNSPRRGGQANISAGMWLVGSQVSPGLYRADVRSGCYWERKRAFAGTLSDIIANEFVSSAGQQFVEIRAGDAGFQSDEDCGTWTRSQAVTTERIEPDQSPSEIEDNWRKKRDRNRQH